MYIYLDVFSNEEILSDSYDIKMVFDGVGGEIESSFVTVGGDKVDVGCGNAFGGGGDDEGDD